MNRYLSSISLSILFIFFTFTAQADYAYEFVPFAMPEDGRIVLPVAEGETLSGLAQLIDAKKQRCLKHRSKGI